MKRGLKKKVLVLTGLLVMVAILSGGYLIWNLWGVSNLLGQLREDGIISEVQKKLSHLRLVIGLTVLAVVLIAAVYVKTVLMRLLFVFRQLSNIVYGFSRGDLMKVPLTGDDEFAELARVYNSAVEGINDIIKTNQRASEILISELKEFNESAVNIENAAERQKAQVEQISSATVEISHVLIEIAKNAHSTKEAAEGTKALVMENSNNIQNIADRVGVLSSVVEKAVQAVSGLNMKMAEINKMLDTIREIAEQTNLLSLNAAIEAARAGEQGRGFAVVAEEVRKLADRSARSAEEISRILQTITEESSRTVVETEQVHRVVGEVMEDIKITEENLRTVIQAAENTLERSSAIASATEENSSAVEQISQSMEALSGSSSRLFDEISRIQEVTAHLEALARELLVHDYRVFGEREDILPEAEPTKKATTAWDKEVSGNGRGYSDEH